MNTAYHTNHADAKRIALAAFPSYKGRKIAIKVANHPLNVRSYWDGGSRDYFVFLRLDNLTTYEMPQQSAFDKKIEGADSVQLVPGMLCIEHCIFQGKDMGITIHVHSENAPNLLPDNNTKLTRDEKIVLVYTRGLKNTYGGRTNIRFLEANREKSISINQWDTAVLSLIEKKMLNKAKAINNHGRNAIGNLRSYEL